MRRVITAASVAIAATAAAQAASFGFQNITGNSAANAAAGEAQLSLSVVAGMGGTAQFTLSNAFGGVPSSVEEIWIDNTAGVLLAISSITNTVGVNFSAPSSSNLPGGNTVGFNETPALGLAASPPPVGNGINPGESLTWTYSIVGGFDIDDVIAAMNFGSLRVGIHVIGFPNGGSESFVTTPVIPAPLGGMLAGAGLLAIGARRRR